MILSKLCIYVENLDEFVELQKYAFTQGINWSGNGKKLFTTWADGTKIAFPRNLMVGSNKNMFNSGMNDNNRFENSYKLKEINGKKLLRKFKLEKLNS
jgi:hypothetical protein